MKVLILGAKGMLGADLAKVFEAEHLILWDKEDLDITKESLVKERIGKLMPEVIINAAAYTDVNKAEFEKELAFLVNGQAVGYLAEVAKEVDAILVHFSTDYVFDGLQKQGYKEDDKPVNPCSVYGQSKLAGEEALLAVPGLKYYLCRISWLFGPSIVRSYKNFVETILNKAQTQAELKVVNDQFGKPTYTIDVAKAVKELLDNKKPFGIYHLSNEPLATWHEFAQEIIKIANLTTKIIPCSTEEFPTIAPRPKRTILLNTKTSALPRWKEALRDYLKTVCV